MNGTDAGEDAVGVLVDHLERVFTRRSGGATGERTSLTDLGRAHRQVERAGVWVSFD